MLSRGYRSRQINGNKFAIEPIERTNSNGRTESVNLFAQLDNLRVWIKGIESVALFLTSFQKFCLIFITIDEILFLISEYI